jgi:hypothetical protein
MTYRHVVVVGEDALVGDGANDSNGAHENEDDEQTIKKKNQLLVLKYQQHQLFHPQDQ